MRGVYSSHVASIGYDHDAQELHVEWSRGKYSVYSGVPFAVAQTVMNSASIGEALHQYVRGAFDHEYR